MGKFLTPLPQEMWNLFPFGILSEVPPVIMAVGLQHIRNPPNIRHMKSRSRWLMSPADTCMLFKTFRIRCKTDSPTTPIVPSATPDGSVRVVIAKIVVEVRLPGWHFNLHCEIG